MRWYMWYPMAAVAAFATSLLHVSVKVDLGGRASGSGDDVHELICYENMLLCQMGLHSRCVCDCIILYHFICGVKLYQMGFVLEFLIHHSLMISYCIHVLVVQLIHIHLRLIPFLEGVCKQAARTRISRQRLLQVVESFQSKANPRHSVSVESGE